MGRDRGLRRWFLIHWTYWFGRCPVLYKLHLGPSVGVLLGQWFLDIAYPAGLGSIGVVYYLDVLDFDIIEVHLVISVLVLVWLSLVRFWANWVLMGPSF